MMKFQTLLLLMLCSLTLFSCHRYDYYPKGIHVYLKDEPKVDKESRIHRVKKGETLYTIGRMYGVDYKKLAKLNGIERPYTIYVGQKILVRGKTSAYSQSSQNKPNKPPKTTKPNKPSKPKGGYTPVSGPHSKPPTVAAPSTKNFKLIWPVKGRLSSKFGPRNNRMHDGIDIAAVVGTKVVAAAAGEVVYSDNKLSGYGNLIIIRHNANMFTAYAHNDENFVVLGDKVTQGQHISNVGETGRVTGPHVHFELRRGDTAIDPMPYLPRR